MADVTVIQQTRRVSVAVSPHPSVRVAAGGAQGQPGPAGPAGGAAYTHIQSAPAATWTIVHNLGRFPSGVLVTDAAGDVVWPDVDVPDVNTVVVTAAAPFAGRAQIG